MFDILLVALILVVSGLLVWSERSRLSSVDLTTESEVTVLGTPDQGYFWRLARPAGLQPDRAWPWFIAAKLLLTIGLPAFLMSFFQLGVPELLASAALGFFVPDLLLAWVRRERQASIRRSLSYFLDLILSLLQAGLTLEEAFRRAAREGMARDHPLAEEAGLVLDELDLGRDRTAGFQALADRTAVPELRSLANALGLGLSSGASIENILRAQAELARARRREAGLQRLNIASAEVLVPLLLCGFPVFVVIVFFPLALIVLKNLELLGASLR